MKKVIHVELNSSSIDHAIRELQNYKKWILEKTQEFLKALGEEGVQISSVKFSEAEYDGTNDVSCSVEERDSTKVAVVAIGNAALFIEFGTGITYADNHPEAAANGMIRGEYGHRLGRLEKGWRYKGDPGTHGEVITEGKHAGEVHTYGNPANMCMYLTIRELEQRFEEIARRVYV